MRTASCRSFLGHYAFNLAAASSIAFMVTACATPRSADGVRPFPQPPRPALTFENSTVEPVTVYLDERGFQFFVGYVMPGQKTLLRLPLAAANPAGREFALVVVPSSARRPLTSLSGAFPRPVTTQQLPGEYLTSVRWKLTGNWLVALAAGPTP